MAQPDLSSACRYLAAHPWFRPPVFLLCGYLLFLQGLTLFLGLPVGLSGNADFKQLYVAGYMVRTGHAHQLYDYDLSGSLQEQLVKPDGTSLPFNHAAYEALLFVPFSYFSYRVAYLLFLLFNLLLYFLVWRLLQSRAAPLAALWKPLAYPPLLVFVPVSVALIQGQDSILLLLFLTLAFFAFIRKKEFSAGLLAALGLFKFQFVLPIALLFLIWRRWRFFAGFAVGGCALALLSLAVAGSDSWRVYAHYMLAMSVRLTQDGRRAFQIFPQSMANLRGLLHFVVSGWMGQRAEQLTVALVSLALLLWAARKKPSFALAVTVAVSVSYHAYSHDLTILLLPMLLCLPEFLTLPSIWPLASLAAIYAAPAVVFFFGLSAWVYALPTLVLLFAIPHMPSPAPDSPM